MKKPIERVGIPRSSFYKIFKQAKKLAYSLAQRQESDWKVKAIIELSWLSCIEKAAKKEISGVFSEKEWMAMAAAFNGINNMFPIPPEDGELVPCRIAEDVMEWEITEWAQYNAAEASQFGDPAVLASVIVTKLRNIGYAGRYLIIRLIMEMWEQNCSDDFLAPVREAGLLN
jgi:hypothetical protein